MFVYMRLRISKFSSPLTLLHQNFTLTASSSAWPGPLGRSHADHMGLSRVMSALWSVMCNIEQRTNSHNVALMEVDTYDTILDSLYVRLMFRRTLQYSLILPIWRRMTDILLRTLLKSRMQSSSCTSIRPTAWDKYNSSTILQIMDKVTDH